MSGPTKRCIWTSKDGLSSLPDDLDDGVYAVVGPLSSHTAEPDFQDAIALVCIETNFCNGSLSEPKYSDLKRARQQRGAKIIAP